MGCDGELRRIAREALTTRPNFAYTLDEVKVGWRGLDGTVMCAPSFTCYWSGTHTSTRPVVAWRAHIGFITFNVTANAPSTPPWHTPCIPALHRVPHASATVRAI